MRRLLSFFYHWSGPALCLAWMIGWMAKDRTPATTWLYFIPPTFVVVYGAIWLAVYRGRGGPVRALVHGLTILAALKVTLVDCSWNARREDVAGHLQVVHWNVGQWNDRITNQLRAIAADQPDICLLSEAPRYADVAQLAQQRLGTPYTLVDAGMALLSKYPFEPLGSLKLTNAKGWAVRIATPKGPLDLVIVDLISHPTLNRRMPISELSDWIANLPASIPVIVLGDFNTPRDALSFDPLRRRLRNAYEIAGRGWPYSWPMPVPVYSIDHAWVSPSVRVLNYSMKGSRLSDHRRQVMDIDIATDGYRLTD
ncbi:MAG: endonuclease/exonuclease/phosphatase family protein [bacterium]